MIEKYISYLRNIKGYSENTCQAYEKDLKDFTTWAKEHVPGARWSSITRSDIDKYIFSMVAANLKPATTNRRLSSISGLYRFFRREGLNVENPCKYESRRKISETIPHTIPINQLKEAYDHAAGIAKVAIGLFMTTGIRIQELLDITWEDINFQEQSIKIKGKGSKERIVFTTEDKLADLLQLTKIKTQKGHVFCMEQRQMRRLIYDALSPYCQAPQLSPHAIRHTFATNAANKGSNVSTLAKAMGHNRIETTQKYIDLRSAPVRSLMRDNNMFN